MALNHNWNRVQKKTEMQPKAVAREQESSGSSNTIDFFFYTCNAKTISWKRCKTKTEGFTSKLQERETC